MRDYLKSRKDYFIILGLVLICVFPLFKMEYSTDTYRVYTITLSGFVGTMFLNGRFITGAFALIFERLSLSIESFYYTSYILSIVFMSLAIYALYTILRGHMRRRLCFFVSFIAVFNACAIEYFLFIEKGAFCFSILMAILALKYFVLFLQGNKNYLFLAFPCLILSAITYQIIPGVFISLSLPFIVKYSKSLKKFLLNNLFAILIYGSGTGIDYLIVKLNWDNQRVGSGIHLSNIWKLYSFTTNHFAFIFLYIGIIALSLGIFALVNKKRTGKYLTKESLLIYAKYFYIVLGAMASAAIPFVFTDPAEVWIMFRVIYPLGALPASILILSKYKEKCNTVCKNKQKLDRGAAVLLSVVILHVVFFNAMCFSRLINNEADKDLCFEIYGEIQKYENESGNKIKEIAIYYDSSITQKNKGVLLIGDCNVRALSRPWCDVIHFTALTGRWFDKVEESKVNQEYKSYFASCSFDSFSTEQLIFDGSTLHLCVY